jgi:hypothetical protein
MIPIFEVVATASSFRPQEPSAGMVRRAGGRAVAPLGAIAAAFRTPGRWPESCLTLYGPSCPDFIGVFPFTKPRNKEVALHDDRGARRVFWRMPNHGGG